MQADVADVEEVFAVGGGPGRRVGGDRGLGALAGLEVVGELDELPDGLPALAGLADLVVAADLAVADPVAEGADVVERELGAVTAADTPAHGALGARVEGAEAVGERAVVGLDPEDVAAVGALDGDGRLGDARVVDLVGGAALLALDVHRAPFTPRIRRRYSASARRASGSRLF
ncbi:MAG: hypothetical protein R3F65_08895 [bacterium]